MVWCRNRQFCFSPELMLVIHERLILSRGEQLVHSCFKGDRPIERLRCVPSPSIGMKIVHDVAAAEDENARAQDTAPDLLEGTSGKEHKQEICLRDCQPPIYSRSLDVRTYAVRAIRLLWKASLHGNAGAYAVECP